MPEAAQPAPLADPRPFEPRIVAFFCNWCTYTAADLAGISRLKYAANVRVVRVMCSGRVDPQFVLDAFANGADGVLIGGCHPGDCHYQEGNYKALRRVHLLKRVLARPGYRGGAVPPRVDLGLRGRQGPHGRQRDGPAGPGAGTAGGPGAARGLRRGGAVMAGAKPKVAFYWCASCGGCEEAVVDLAEKVIDVAAAVDIVFWPVALDFKRKDVEALPDGAIAATFLNGAIRTTEHEEMAHLLRRKSQVLDRLRRLRGARRHPGPREPVGPRERSCTRSTATRPAPTTRPACCPERRHRADGHEVELPGFYDTVRSLDQVVEVDYTIPGCPPTPELLADAVTALLNGHAAAEGRGARARHRALRELPAQAQQARPALDPRLQAAARGASSTRSSACSRRGSCAWARPRGAAAAAAASRGTCPAPGASGRPAACGTAAPRRSRGSSRCSRPRTTRTSAKAIESIPDPVGTFYRYTLAGVAAAPEAARHGVVSARSHARVDG